MPNLEPGELSEREVEILKLVATGASNKEIAQQLFISSNTVKVHLRNIFTKIGANSRTEAAMYAVRMGMAETVSVKIGEDEVGLQASENHQTELPIQPVAARIRNLRYMGLLVVLFLSLLILGGVFFRDQIIPTNAINPPTPTTRVQWFELPGLTVPRSGLAVTSYENQIYAIGGEVAGKVSNVVERYDPQTNTWTRLTSKPIAVTDISAVTMGGLIYVPGGKTDSGITTNSNEIFDPQTNQWSKGGPLPRALSAYALTVYEGRMYLFGGWDGHRVVKDAYVYDPNDDVWAQIVSMPTARSYAGAVVMGGKIYVIGGWDGQKAVNVNESYLPENIGAAPPWTEAKSLPTGRYGMGITNMADIIFIIGGTGSDDDLTVIALSQEDDNWGQIEAPLHKGWSTLGATTVGTRLYAMGGKTEEGLSDQMWSYQVIFTITLPIVR